MNKLEIILKELAEHKRDKKTLLTSYIQERLDKSIQVYYKDLLDSYNFIKNKNELKIARKLNKELKND